MNAMTDYTVKSLRANRIRTAVTIAGVALAAALLTAVLTSYTSLCDFLYRTEAATSGMWMANVSTHSDADLDEGLSRAGDDPDVSSIATLRDVGFAELDETQRQKLGPYQTVVSADGDIGEMLGIHVASGRLPQSKDEILLYQIWNRTDGIEVGDEITFDVGRRIAVAPDGQEDAQMSAGWLRVGVGDSGEGVEADIENGTELSSEMGYLDSSVDGGGSFDEMLVDTQRRTYTVVGFYDRVNYALYCGIGPVALTVGDEPLTEYAETYLVMDNMHTSDEIRQAAEGLFSTDEVTLHTAMLRYMGIASDTSIWTTFIGLIVILSAVIILACISLIFNAFAISVAERTSQFGLLSSVGATRRQIRRAIGLEAVIVASIGIPLGILIGVGGCAVTFAILGPSIAEIAGGGVVPFGLKVDATVIAAAVVLTLLTVFISAWIPAKRASGTGIIDALRGAAGSRVSKRGERRAAACTDAKALWRYRGLVSRFFGVGGKLAAINRSRGASKGRTASASLALAIVLLMTAGSLNVFLSTLVNAVTGGYSQAGEVAVKAQFDADDSLSDTPIDAQGLLVKDNEDFAAQSAIFRDAYGYLSETPNADPKGWMLGMRVLAVLPPEMVEGSDGSASDMSGSDGRMADGNYAAEVQVNYIDDGLFNEYAKSAGTDPGLYYDALHPRAIGISKGYGNGGGTYRILDKLTDTGMVDVLASAVYMDRFPVYMSIGTEDAKGSEHACLMAYFAYADGSEEQGGRTLSENEVDIARVGLEVAALTEAVPETMGGIGESITLIVPMSLADAQGFGATQPLFTGLFDSLDGDHAQLAEELSANGSQFFGDDCPYELSFYTYNDYVAEMDSSQMLATIVNVFCLLFTVILALIALANVFNTVTNSLILRRREFAVMRSIGLSNRQFRRMIMDECANFGIVGLIPGLLISFSISYLIFLSIGQSVSGLAFMLPWTYVALAVGMTAFAIAISVAYGLHRCRASNVVEALRSDSI